MIYWIFYFITKVLSFLFFPCTFIGRENIPIQGPFIVASNHISNFDPFIIGIGFNQKINYLAKEELFKSFLGNFLFRHAGAFPIKRGTSDLGAIREVFRRLKSGKAVVLFPEGTRTVDSSKRKIEAGVGMIAVKSGVPILPICINGSDKIFSFGFFKRCPVTIVFGKPTSFVKGKSHSMIAHEIMDSIFFLSNQK